ARLAWMKSAGALRFASMPPTLAAARNTYSGRSFEKKRSTAAASARSSADRSRVISARKPSARSRRSSAAPIMPRWPATKIRLACSTDHPPVLDELADAVDRRDVNLLHHRRRGGRHRQLEVDAGER